MYIIKSQTMLRDRKDGAKELAKLIRWIQLYVSRGFCEVLFCEQSKHGYFVWFEWRAVMAGNWFFLNTEAPLRVLFFLNYLTFNLVFLSRIRKRLHLKALEKRKEFNPSKIYHPHFLMRLLCPPFNCLYELELRNFLCLYFLTCKMELLW